jgi:outer membrane protein assembly factor BamB
MRSESGSGHGIGVGNKSFWTFLTVSALGAGCTLAPILATGSDWPQFRGPHASGVSEQSAPERWDAATGQNIRWQTPIPGLGHASPIIWKDRLYVATAIRPGQKADLKIGLYGDGDSYKEKESHQWRLLCLDKATGRVLWDKLEHEAVPRVERHTKATHCNSTPATDGKHIAAIFGSEGLFCFDMEGKLLWHKDLGKMDGGPYDAPSLQWGFASSPVIQDGKIIVQCDVLSGQSLAAFNAADGKELWRTKREDVATWSTPLVVVSPGRAQVVVSGWKHLGGYDLASGKELWSMREGGDVPVASPILSGDVAIMTSGHGKYRPIRAVRLDAAGDITPTEMGATNQAVLWCHPRKGNYLQTPIVVGDKVWGCSNDGIVSCFDRKTGNILYEERIGNGAQGFTSSPVAAGNRLYFTGEQGETFVLPTTSTFSVVATNKLGGICLATPAVADGRIYFRTTEEVVAIGAAK